ncbi:ABC transporter ATP-binding protein [Maritalea porphyrae]|uniref:ABC transporter ATP-binding protein n=1 Tax=Maritalea porphyrae TaxID=880732 RepID=UPI0022AF44E2|nr:oligopeptide/dipeptide ABC transporter ATP-binding protein [Maritalea porphyrae]MCZ4272488.1 ATP-binding cassette domain-containing protein [Maritalea porphyrae]
MSAENREAPLLEVSDLKVHFGEASAPVKAVDGVSFSIGRGETLGLVGESGCGKTTTGMAIVNLVKSTGGSILFEGREITSIDHLSRAEQLQLRSQIQIVFQDPFSSLNPRMSLFQTLDQPLKIHGMAPQDRRERIDMLLDRVGLNPAHASRYAHEFSGGQRQRIGIARALALNPKLIICDEAVSALDVSIQAQIINLLIDLQEEFGLSYLFISHDLAVVEHLADRVAVMYLGKIIEAARYDEVFSAPKHPYTRALLSSIPVPDPKGRGEERQTIKGEMPSPFAPPSGCHFHPRCPVVMAKCKVERPSLEFVDEEHQVSCHLSTKQADTSLGTPKKGELA